MESAAAEAVAVGISSSDMEADRLGWWRDRRIVAVVKRSDWRSSASSNTVPENGGSETFGQFILLFKQAHADTQAPALARGRTNMSSTRGAVCGRKAGAPAPGAGR